MSFRDRIARTLMGAPTREVVSRPAPVPGYTPAQWQKELADRARATAEFNAHHEAYYTPEVLATMKTEFAAPPLPPTMAPKPEFTPQQWQREQLDRANAQSAFDEMIQREYGR